MPQVPHLPGFCRNTRWKHGDEVVVGSTAITRHISKRYNITASTNADLFPAQAAQDVADAVKRFARDLGPAAIHLAAKHLLSDAELCLDVASRNVGPGLELSIVKTAWPAYAWGVLQGLESSESGRLRRVNSHKQVLDVFDDVAFQLKLQATSTSIAGDFIFANRQVLDQLEQNSTKLHMH